MRPMTHRTLLLMAGLGTLGVAGAQALMPFSRALVHVLDGPSDWSTPLLVAASVVVAALFAYMGACALSLAGVIRPLPLRRVMVVIAAFGFMVRGFSLVPQLLAETGFFDPADGAGAAQMLASGVSLALGVLYFAGLTHPKSLAPAGKRVQAAGSRRLAA